MKFVQLMTVPAFVFCMTAPSLASWPVLNCEVQQLRQGGHEAQNFRSIVTSEVRVSIKGPKFTAIDIEDQADDKLINCSFKVGYAERKDWSALNFRDVVEPSWKLFPTDSDSRKSGELRNLTTLIAAIDSLGLHAKRSSRERVSVDGKGGGFFSVKMLE